ncbi:hypothetical protein ACMFMF_006594 [Clarireedia jacksonii]
MERIIGAHPGVNAVLFVGTRRPKGALLVELRNPSDDKEVFLDSLWPLVEEANKPVSFTAKITKDMMLITDAELPMARSMKGTIERRSTVKLYKERLDVLKFKAKSQERPEQAEISMPYTFLSDPAPPARCMLTPRGHPLTQLDKGAYQYVGKGAV